MYTGDKSSKWIMRCSEKDVSRISRLAKRLGVNQSEAVRRAVKNMLAANTACSGRVLHECPKCGTTLKKGSVCPQHGLPVQPRR